MFYSTEKYYVNLEKDCVKLDEREIFGVKYVFYKIIDSNLKILVKNGIIVCRGYEDFDSMIDYYEYNIMCGYPGRCY